MIPFNKPLYIGSEDKHVMAAMRSSKISGDGQYTHLCHEWFERQTGCKKALLTPSCTQALEMAAILLDIKPGDEVIMPSYTFVSTANAFVLRGAEIVFVDIRPDTMNIDENLIEAAITHKTKAIVPVHYAGVACEMDTIMAIAARHQLFVIEDAAQGMMATYKGRALGSIGHMGAYSFHETKNYTSGGEGGLLLINDERFIARAEIIREKGTNRSQFFRGMADKYTWVDVGSSYLPCDIQAAYLWAQLDKANDINNNRLSIWREYRDLLKSQAEQGLIKLPCVPDGCAHNAHMFYVKVNDINVRTDLIDLLKRKGVLAAFHYIPLHSASAGEKFGRFHGVDSYTTLESEKLLRLPLWFDMNKYDVTTVAINTIQSLEELCRV